MHARQSTAVLDHDLSPYFERINDLEIRSSPFNPQFQITVDSKWADKANDTAKGTRLLKPKPRQQKACQGPCANLSTVNRKERDPK